jgi:alkane 1-monooxygenase
MLNQLLSASGYLFVFAAPALLAAGVGTGQVGLAFFALFLLSPFLRILFGDAKHVQPEWRESIATGLEALPQLYVAAFAAGVGYVLWKLHDTDFEGWQWPLLGMSLWTVFVFASCVAHELVHRRSEVSRVLGRLLSGAIGYPLLEHEHRAHHGATGDVDAAEWPRLDESLWRFTARRCVRVVQSAWEGNTVAAQRRGRKAAGGLPLAFSALALTWLAFALAGGAAGATLYAAVAALLFWSMQAITYVQHWGLGHDSVPDARQVHYGWEDGCRLQMWLTLSISCHQAHHHKTTTPFYRQMLMPESPRMPAGYVILLFASMVPPVWRAVMLPALTRWKRSPSTQPTPGRRLLCYSRSPK